MMEANAIGGGIGGKEIWIVQDKVWRSATEGYWKPMKEISEGRILLNKGR